LKTHKYIRVKLNDAKSEHFVPCYKWPVHGNHLTALLENIEAALTDEMRNDINRIKMAQDVLEFLLIELGVVETE
jgi:vacuolar-type H+-ATPase subunit D/Vma8